MSLEASDKFQHILRVLNTNVDGKIKIPYALTKIRGVGRRFATLVCKKADIDLNLRAGECSEEQVEKIITVMQNPLQYKIPSWFLNRKNDTMDGKSFQAVSNNLETKLREDLERMKKMRLHRGIRHYWGIKVRGQHTNSTGRHRRVSVLTGK